LFFTIDKESFRITDKIKIQTEAGLVLPDAKLLRFVRYQRFWGVYFIADT
jgi:hypothetical protein